MKSEIDLTVCQTGKKAGSNKLFQFKKELIRLLIVITVLIFTAVYMPGCTNQPEVVYRTVYKDVLVPVKCDITLPIRPIQTDSPVLNTLNIIEYTQTMEIALKACRGE